MFMFFVILFGGVPGDVYALSPTSQRIDYILQHTNLMTQIMQMQNSGL
jgi:hypothetical protein